MQTRQCKVSFHGSTDHRPISGNMDEKLYTENLRDIVNHGFITCALGLGQKLGIFDVLIDTNKSVTATELADACNLRERYVEEWLGCMTASRVVIMDDQNKYYIPQNCKKGLPVVRYSPWIFFAGEIHMRTMECFTKNGPMGYDYLQLPDSLGDWLDSRIDYEQVMEELLIPLREYGGKMEIILEIGMGMGALSRSISKLLPDAQYYGLDCHPKYVDKAKELAAKENFENVTYLLADVENLPQEWTNKFDWIILYDVLHDLPHPKSAMDEIRRVLKDDGFSSIVDPKIHSSHRDNLGDTNAGKFYAGSCFTCLPCSSSKEYSAKLGIGWGEENKQTFLERNGWQVKDKRVICNNLSHYSFTCTKAL